MANVRVARESRGILRTKLFLQADELDVRPGQDGRKALERDRAPPIVAMRLAAGPGDADARAAALT